MKMPQEPPDHWSVWDKLRGSDRMNAVLADEARRTPNDRYLHWDKLRHLKPPGSLDHREWWLALKLHRHNQYKAIPLTDVRGEPFKFGLPDPIPEALHHIDQGATGSIAMPDPITNPETRDRYLVGSLIEEAITSSQLEGAATTREVAKDMIRAGRAPRDRSEQMILNNFLTMQRIGKLKQKRLTEDVIFEIHRIVTSETLDDPLDAGRFRLADQRIDIRDNQGQVFHEPPPAEQLGERMAAMCDFANGKTPEGFVHPVIRSIILHFWLAYDHPFVDGNGRTARALFYWSMLHHGFWLCEFISISQIILKAPAKYGRAFLYTETDDNDLTYFLIYHLEVTRRAIDQLHAYVRRKTKQLQAVERELRGVAVLNHRQRALISHALRHPHHRYTIASHRRSHDVTYQTARTDLLDLAERGLLEAAKIGKEWNFTPMPKLEQRLGKLT